MIKYMEYAENDKPLDKQHSTKKHFLYLPTARERSRVTVTELFTFPPPTTGSTPPTPWKVRPHASISGLFFVCGSSVYTVSRKLTDRK